MATLLMVNNEYSICGYCVINGYYINGYWWLSMAILLMAISGYYVVSH
jgi:hypothetical protein